ncbi:helix-turn-helix transcriptional regulator [Streptococcus uberis]
MTEKQNNKIIGLRIKKIRLEKGMTLEEFGRLFNASKGSVYGWETGRNLPNKDRLKLISKIGEMRVEELIAGNLYEDLEKKFDEIISSFPDYVKNASNITKLKKNIVQEIYNSATNYFQNHENWSNDEMYNYAFNYIEDEVLKVIEYSFEDNYSLIQNFLDTALDMKLKLDVAFNYEKSAIFPAVKSEKLSEELYITLSEKINKLVKELSELSSQYSTIDKESHTFDDFK